MYNSIISVENLLAAWKEFLKGKRSKKDVQDFQYRLAENILDLHNDLKNRIYKHDGYHAFNISDPKPRNIHKATVRDRLLHHAIYRKLYDVFDPILIHDSYSCRKHSGTHKAIKRFIYFSYKASKNHTQTLWSLKCDVRKFFASIDQAILMETVKRHISDPDTLLLIQRVVESFSSEKIGNIGGVGKGLPLGNLTSQLLVNVYMNEFDQYMKHVLKQKYYIRYADDFVVMHQDRGVLKDILPKISDFLEQKLKLNLHPDKVFIKTVYSGVDFLGWMHFPDHRILRTSTKKRMFGKLKRKSSAQETVRSYIGLLKHGNAHILRDTVAKYEHYTPKYSSPTD